MHKRIFTLMVFLLFGLYGNSQILVTQLGQITFFNSLDSTKADFLTGIARHCDCLLYYEDSSHSVGLRLDIDSTSDSSYYQLGYDNLYGNAWNGGDSSSVGIYIKARDTVLKAEKIMLLVDYGLKHFNSLKTTGMNKNFTDPEIITKLFAQKPSLKWKRLIASCH